MIQIIIKLFLSSGIIIIVSEIAKKNTFLGGLIASIPIISVLSIIWLYIDTKDIQKIETLSNSFRSIPLYSNTILIHLDS